MNLHEYQAKELLKRYNVPVQEGIAAGTVAEAEEAYRQIKTQYNRQYQPQQANKNSGTFDTLHCTQGIAFGALCLLSLRSNGLLQQFR